MIRLAVSVEGRTEEQFVKRVLADHLLEAGVEPKPILIGRARGKGRPGGGAVSVERLASEMESLYWNFDAVTSLVDFYGFRERKDEETIDELESRLLRRIQERIAGNPDPRRIIPYVQQYEFEGLLFSDVNAFTVSRGASAESLQALRVVRTRFPTPEDINDHPETAPSKRIAGAMPRYRKVIDGASIARETGLQVIRRECPRFNGWVERSNALGRLR